MQIITTQEFESEVLKADKSVLVDFYADWCGPCKMVAPSLEKLEKKYGEKIKIVKLNIDQDGEIAVKYNVMSIPTLIIFKDGVEADKVTEHSLMKNLRHS